MGAERVARGWSVRRIFRYSIRALMLLVLVLAVPLGWVVNRAHRQRDMVERIRQTGGEAWYAGEAEILAAGHPGLKWLADTLGVDFLDTIEGCTIGRMGTEADLIAAVEALPAAKAIGIRGARVSARGIRALGTMPALERVWFERCTLGPEERAAVAALTRPRELVFDRVALDGALAFLEPLAALESLTITETPIRDASLASLARLTRLQELTLDRTGLTDAGMPHLAALKNLTLLVLSRNAVGDPGVEHLRGMRLLSFLMLDRTRVGDRGLKTLAALPELTSLSLVGTRVTDSGLAEMGRFPTLQFLNLDETEVGDAGLGAIKVSRTLSVGVERTRVTPAGIKRFRMSNPLVVVDGVDEDDDPAVLTSLPTTAPPAAGPK